MGMWFRAIDGVVAEVTDHDPVGRFHPDIVWLAGADGAEPGDLVSAAGVLSRPAAAAPEPPSRIVTSAAFLALFTPAEIAALWSADPRLMLGALHVIIQGNANLGSPEAADLLTLAVVKGALSDAERTRIIAGQPPAAA